MIHNSPWAQFGICSAFLLTATAFVQADSPGKKESSKSSNETEQATPFDPTKASGWHRPEKGIGLFASGDLLWWHAYQGGMDYAITSKTVQSGGSPDSPIDGSVKRIKFDFDYGFRVGLGYIVPSKIWDINLYWTHFKSSESSSVNPPPDGSLYSTRELIYTGNPVTHASARWKINLNYVALELGRAFTLTRNLAMRPHFGFAGAQVNQKMRFNNQLTILSTATTSQAREKNNFLGWGICGGLDTRWLFAKYWSIYGDLAAAAVWGRFNLEQKAHSDLSPVTDAPFTTKLHNHFHRTVALLQLGLGLRFDAYLNSDSWHLGFNLGYEFNEWFDQNQLRAADGAFLIGNAQQLRNSGNLGFQGITAGARVDF